MIGKLRGAVYSAYALETVGIVNQAIEDGAGLDLAQFRRWYSQAGTLRVSVSQEVVGDGLKLTLRQVVPATPGQSDKQPMPIPLRLAIHSRKTGALGPEQGRADLGPVAVRHDDPKAGLDDLDEAGTIKHLGAYVRAILGTAQFLDKE